MGKSHPKKLTVRDILRGVVPEPLRVIPRKLGGRILDRFYGIRTEGWYRLKASDRHEARHDDGISYQPCPYRLLWAVLKRLPATPDDVFYDLGCGKGRVLCAYAASGRFRKCVGVELVTALAEAARRNASLVRAKSPIVVIGGDAAAADLRDGTVFFFHNPFGTETIGTVLRNLEATWDGRRIWIACCGLYPEKPFDACSWLERHSSSGRIAIWKSISGRVPAGDQVPGASR